MVYTPKLAAEIAEEITSRGWNLYCLNGYPRKKLPLAIRNGPAGRLELESRYAILPKVIRACDPFAVLSTQDYLKRENKQFHIEIDGRPTEVRLLITDRRSVAIRTPEKFEWMSYNGVLKRANTMSDYRAAWNS